MELLARLERKREAIDIAIAEIRALDFSVGLRRKAKDIVKSAKTPRWVRLSKLRTKIQREQKKIDAAKKQKPHWTQTVEGKMKMADVQRKAWRARKKAGLVTPSPK